MAVADDLSLGGAIRVGKLKDIETVMSEMWRAAAKSEPGADGAPQSVTRACLSNVVIVTGKGQCDALANELDALSIRRPSRILVAEVDEARDGAGVEASIRAVCHKAPTGPQWVCCEQIHLSCGPEDFELLPGIVAPLLEPDLPSLLWWDRDWSDTPEILLALARGVGALLHDLEKVRRFETLRKLEPLAKAIAVRDLAWQRIEPWRQELAHVFDDVLMQPMLGELRSVTVTGWLGASGEVSASSLLLLGWLAAQLGWDVRGPLVPKGDERLAKAVRKDGGEVQLAARKAEGDPAGAALESVVLIGAKESEVRLKLLGKAEAIGIAVTVAESCPLPRRAVLPSSGIGSVIGAALESAAAPSPVYQKALSRALLLKGA